MPKTLTADPLARPAAGSPGPLFDLAPPPERPERLPPLAYGGRPPSRPTDTSRAAAAKQGAKAPPLRVAVLAFVRGCPGGATAEEVGAHLAALRGLPADNTACRLGAGARLTELKLGGFLRDSGRRRPTAAGSPAIVWAATPKPGDGSVCERPGAGPGSPAAARE